MKKKEKGLPKKLVAQRMVSITNDLFDSKPQFTNMQHIIYSGIVAFFLNALPCFIFWSVDWWNLRLWLATWFIIYVISRIIEEK